MTWFRYCFFCLAATLLLPFHAARAAGSRTFDALTSAELDALSGSTLTYYTCVTDKLDAMPGPDRSMPERILATSPPYVLMARQQCRISLINVERLLYSYGLNPEFITNHVNTLRDDVTHFALWRTMQGARTAKEDQQYEDEWEKAAKPQEKKPKPRSGPLGIFTAPAKPEEEKK